MMQLSGLSFETTPQRPIYARVFIQSPASVAHRSGPLATTLHSFVGTTLNGFTCPTQPLYQAPPTGAHGSYSGFNTRRSPNAMPPKKSLAPAWRRRDDDHICPIACFSSCVRAPGGHTVQCSSRYSELLIRGVRLPHTLGCSTLSNNRWYAAPPQPARSLVSK